RSDEPHRHRFTDDTFAHQRPGPDRFDVDGAWILPEEPDAHRGDPQRGERGHAVVAGTDHEAVVVATQHEQPGDLATGARRLVALVPDRDERGLQPRELRAALRAADRAEALMSVLG